MTIDKSDLKDVYRSYLGAHQQNKRHNCPSSKDIAASFESSAPIRLKKKIVDHLSECALCYEEFLLLLKHQEVHWEDPQLSRQRNVLRKGPWYGPSWQGIAVIVSLTFILTTFFLIKHTDNPPTRQVEMTGVSLITPEKDSILSMPFLFKWQSKGDNDYFILNLYEETLKPIWTSMDIKKNFVSLPTEVVTKLVPGRFYYWMITSYFRGEVSGESKLGRFLAGR